jgi:hypothetical protein
MDYETSLETPVCTESSQVMNDEDVDNGILPPARKPGKQRASIIGHGSPPFDQSPSIKGGGQAKTIYPHADNIQSRRFNTGWKTTSSDHLRGGRTPCLGLNRNLTCELTAVRLKLFDTRKTDVSVSILYLEGKRKQSKRIRIES